MILQPTIKIKVETQIQLFTDNSLASFKVSCQICETLARPQATCAVFQHCSRERGFQKFGSCISLKKSSIRKNFSKYAIVSDISQIGG